ncbi:MAG: inorganic phosphate transporter [Gammaproteobacteria bacterium RIFCSPHIGHO2_02_FULL_39_13]|nr:MAG: inorganic phosphate transporter [Gammaproteobacteria bacterium RIFCSPHIGHO2_02_FULL_39_13]OGT48478.1 MAG: inorganic phosphate transporter [Gammaproteobacteria bacterium RIFCSPHIGHO2_12_FULL_39_24]
MTIHLTFILLVVFLALVFDFTNGFHDAGNSIATIVATNVLTPLQAVAWAAFFNFIAFLFFKLSVASTMGSGLIHQSYVDSYLIFSVVVSAIIWNIVTWFYGLPSSSSHALIGGLAGSALAKGGVHALVLSGFIKVIAAIILSPIIGMLFGYLLTVIVNYFTIKNTEAINHYFFKYVQLISSALLSLTHGGNDAQKTMGIIAVLLYSSGYLGNHFHVPFWIVIACHFVIALGTLFGGWRIVHTMGKKITQLNTLRGTCAETGAAIVIFAATDLGIPISTTQTVTGSIAGVGLSQSFFGVHWPTMSKIFLTWIVTIPVTALIAAGMMLL